MSRIILQIVLLMLKCVVTVPPTGSSTNNNLQEEIDTLKYTTKMLSVQLEKWNNLFLTSLEPRLASSASSLASIDSNVHNLQERAHVWDTFQLHVSAWNDQLATLDRKADIISKGQEKIIALDSKISSVTNIEYKMDDVVKKMDDIQETLSDLKEDNQKQRDRKDSNVLFGEFAARGILSTIKMVEKKLDRLILAQNPLIRAKSSEEKPKLTIKCNTPRIVEELLNDISSKVDIIFDSISSKEENEYIDEYMDGSGMEPLELRTDNKLIKKMVKRMSQPCRKFNQPIEELLERTSRIENTSRVILDKTNINLENFNRLLLQCSSNSSFAILNKIDQRGLELSEKLHKIIAQFESLANQEMTTTSNTPSAKIEPNKTGCSDLDKSHESGVYVFGTPELNAKNRTYIAKYCMVRDGGPWTVIQRRAGGDWPQNFNLSWFDYKNGFGNLDGDFWLGNDFISRLSNGTKQALRIELEDFDGNFVWAEYSSFCVLTEGEGYKLEVGGYRGNASDSFSSHNNSLFSTFDRKNDQAPECCPCSVSYGGGWWFNSCFESNLNGIYHKKPEGNGYFSGIIWESWLGNYSLKKTLMMVKPHFEDP